MLRLSILFGILIFTTPLWAVENAPDGALLFYPKIYLAGEQPDRTSRDYCGHVNDPTHFLRLAGSGTNRLIFLNDGGLLNHGVCWWHSRFTRAALYLTIFRPDLPRPTRKEARKLISRIGSGKSVVTIPGFWNLSQFSYLFQDLIQKYLDRWQVYDGIARHAWINGLEGKLKTSAAELKQRMDDIYAEFRKRSQLLYLKLPSSGGSHSVLVVDMIPTATGYVLTLVDSNEFEIVTFTYDDSMTSLKIGPKGTTTPYLEEMGELDRIQTAMREYCSQ